MTRVECEQHPQHPRSPITCAANRPESLSTSTAKCISDGGALVTRATRTECRSSRSSSGVTPGKHLSSVEARRLNSASSSSHLIPSTTHSTLTLSRCGPLAAPNVKVWREHADRDDMPAPWALQLERARCGTARQNQRKQDESTYIVSYSCADACGRTSDSAASFVFPPVLGARQRRCQHTTSPACPSATGRRVRTINEKYRGSYCSSLWSWDQRSTAGAWQTPGRLRQPPLMHCVQSVPLMGSLSQRFRCAPACMP